MSSALGTTFGARHGYLSVSFGFRRSRAFTQEMIRGAQGAHLFNDRDHDELVQRSVSVAANSAVGFHQRGKFQWIGVLARFLILWTITLEVTTSMSKSRGASKRSRTLYMTMAEARPFTAASSH
jgi:hypothetical protein